MILARIVSSLALALSLSLPSQAVITGNAIAAYSGPNCSGNMGTIVPCDSSCHQFTGRQSHLVSDVSSSLWHFAQHHTVDTRALQTGSPGNHCIRYFQGDGCTSPLNSGTLSGPNECRNVAASLNIKSFECDPTNECRW